MRKIILFFFLSSLTLFSASNEQILQYLSLSQSDQQLIAIEQVFDSMRQTQEQNESNEENESTSQVSIVYQEYLEEHLSSMEIEEILALYRQPIMQRYVTEVKTFTVNDDDMDAFLKSLKEEPLTTEREDIVDEIIKVLINEKLQLSFYRSMMQRYVQKADENSSTLTSKENNETKMTPREQSYVDSMKKTAKEHLLYGSQVFSIEEMKELKEAIGSSIFSKVKRVENEALVQIMNDYIRGVVSKPKRAKEKKKGK